MAIDFGSVVEQMQSGAEPQAPPPVPVVIEKPRFPAIQALKDDLVQRWNPEFAAILQAYEVVNGNVNSQAAAKAATGITKNAKALFNKLEDERKAFTEPVRAFTASVNNVYKSFTDRLTQIEADLKQGLVSYQNQMELERRKAAKAAQEEAAKLQAKLDAEAKEAGVEAPQVVAPVVVPHPTTVRSEQGTAYQVSSWEFEVEELDKVPREYLALDVARVRQAVKAGLRKIPGLRIFEKKEMRVR